MKHYGFSVLWNLFRNITHLLQQHTLCALEPKFPMMLHMLSDNYYCFFVFFLSFSQIHLLSARLAAWTERWRVPNFCWTLASGCGWCCPSSSSPSLWGSSVTMSPSCCTATRRLTWSRCPTGETRLVLCVCEFPCLWLAEFGLSIIWCLCSFTVRCSCAAASSGRMGSTSLDRWADAMHSGNVSL